MCYGRQSRSTDRSSNHQVTEICILAGGSSTRMGRDKTRVRVGPRTLLGHVRMTAGESGLPIRVIRHDHVPRCGPLGGVYTALVTSRAGALLFLSCDMPFVTPDLLRKLVSRFHRRERACFVVKDGVAGFPFLLRRADLGTAKQLLSRRHFSLQNLAKALRAEAVRVRDGSALELFNVNTPAELKVARQHWRDRAGKKGSKKAAPDLVNRRPFR